MFAASDPLRIAIVPGVTVAKWTRAWQERRRDTPVTVTPVEEADQTSVLRDGTADVSFVRLPIDRADLSVIRLYSEVAVVVASKDHPIAAMDSILLSDLVDETMRTEPIHDAIDLVAAGHGIVVVPHSIARLHARKDLIARPVTDAEPTDIGIAWLQDATSNDIEEFVGIVRGRTAASSRGGAPVPEPKQESTPKAQPAIKRQSKRPQARQPRGGAGRNRGRGRAS